jgi:S1-C subfamily serine protease
MRTKNDPIRLSIRVLLLHAVVSAALGLGCAASEPARVAAPPEEVVPIPLGPLGSHTMVFQKVLYRIPGGAVIGEARIGSRVVDEMRWESQKTQSFEFNVAVTDRLRGLGYEMRDAADALFEPNARIQVRYELAAVMREVALDFDYERDFRTDGAGEGRGTADVRLELRLFDTLAKETVYVKSFTGYGEDFGREPRPITFAVVDAVAKATADPEFVTLLAISDSSAVATGGEEARLAIAHCGAPRSVQLPAEIDEVLESIVAIQVGKVWGAGVIVSPEGWVLAAEHVVGDDNEIWVHLQNGLQLPATLVRKDRRLDLALLRLVGRGYPCSRPRVGQPEPRLGSDVFAVSSLDERTGGRPTISRGVVSGFPEKAGIRFLQTDASVNAGSSGGPLVASDGSIAGIIVQKRLGPGVEGIALAVPMAAVVEGLSLELSSSAEREP